MSAGRQTSLFTEDQLPEIYLSEKEMEKVLVTYKGLAALFGVYPTTIYKFHDEGLPKPKEKNRYHLIEAAGWILGNKFRPRGKGDAPGPAAPGEEEDWDTQFRKERALHEGVKRAEKEGKLMDAREARSDWARRIISAKTRLMALAEKLPPLLAHETDHVRIKDILVREFTDALRSIKSGQEESA